MANDHQWEEIPEPGHRTERAGHRHGNGNGSSRSQRNFLMHATMQDAKISLAQKQIAGPGVSGVHGDTIRIQGTDTKKKKQLAADVKSAFLSFCMLSSSARPAPDELIAMPVRRLPCIALVREDVCALTTRVWRRVPRLLLVACIYHCEAKARSYGVTYRGCLFIQ